MSRRYRMSRRSSKRDFKKKTGVHRINALGGGNIMRGGIRL